MISDQKLSAVICTKAPDASKLVQSSSENDILITLDPKPNNIASFRNVISKSIYAALYQNVATSPLKNTSDFV
ncbi:Uncharacterized protein YR821_p20014 (plasmid) [Yersinia ruckeri]|nr:Uncharacterized protein YR821_p20014 [Yersinia ruckeri]